MQFGGGTHTTTQIRFLQMSTLSPHASVCDRHMAREIQYCMASIRETGFLFFLLLNTVCSEEPEPVFRPEEGEIEMGYCFGVDYIVIYRSAPDGDQILGNSSAGVTSLSPPADLQGRVSITGDQQLLGLQIKPLKHSDSGIYRRECWQNATLVKQHQQQLYVCNDEVEAEEIIVMQDGGAELLCNSSFIGLNGVTVRWYHEPFPSYKATLFLDSSVSLEPLVEELQGVVEVGDGGVLLRVTSQVLKDSHFNCLVMKDDHCLSFQAMYLPVSDDIPAIFASQEDRVVLPCQSDQTNQRWETPVGNFNATTKTQTSANGNVKSDQITFDDKSGTDSLVIAMAFENHTGFYTCYSPALIVEYKVVVCPRVKPKAKSVSEGGEVSLECEIPQEKSHSVQWHRRGSSGEDTLIHNSKDRSVLIAEELRGRVILSEQGSFLNLTGLTMNDAGAYFCVVLGGSEYLETDDNYDEDDYGEDGWSQMDKCLSKQETILTVESESESESVPVPKSGGDTDSPTPDPSATSNTTAYALTAALTAILVIGGIAVVIGIKKKRAKASQKHRSAFNVEKDTGMNLDPTCTNSLTPGD